MFILPDTAWRASYDFLDQRKHVVMMPRHPQGSKDPSGGRTFKVTLTHQGLGSWHCVCCRQNRTAGAQPGPPGILTVCVFFFPNGRAEHGWLGGKEGSADELYIYGLDGKFRETWWGGSLPELMLYQVVRYCSMGPDGGLLREELGVGEKMWEWHAQ